MAKAAKPTEWEKQIIASIQRHPDEYSVKIISNEIYHNGEMIGTIRKKFIPYIFQYQHEVINKLKPFFRDIQYKYGICPIKGVISERKKKCYNQIADLIGNVGIPKIRERKNFNRFADIINSIDHTITFDEIRDTIGRTVAGH